MDKNISEAVELLYKGAKMLAQHCLDCKMPLFEYEGKIICPACKREFRINKKGQVIPIENEEKKEIKKDEKDDGNIINKIDKKEDVRKHLKTEDSYTKCVDKIKYLEAKSILKSKLFEIILRAKECESLECLNNLINLSLKIIELLEKIEKV
ncbi:Sjogren's syndrome/scleroderma autoantigen 1 family protein [Archaeoglobus sp.]